MEHTSREPQRLSALYQYHNAPEVAPAHGLEYDDTNYPSSDKYPVVHSSGYDSSKYSGKHAYSDNRPPRIIFGMKVPTFLVVAGIIVLIVVGAAVGGAVGGKSMRENQSQVVAAMINSTVNATSTASASPTVASAFIAPTPTYSPLSDCPQSNNTFYTSSMAASDSSKAQSDAGLNFTKYCDVDSPLSNTGAKTLSEAFVYSFSDCVEVCASLNFYAGDGNCSVAVYQPNADRPGNCWVGSANTTFSQLGAKTGIDVALLSS